ncbi:MAG: response regulator transcription factor [Kiritimatiellae bacterium]|nr:response regulator transcription factor [Kiritimatiellia bacterium]
MNILLVDDHSPTQKEMQRLIANEKDMTVVGAVGTGELAVQEAKALRPDVIVMDIILPGINGIEATRQILNQQPRSRIVALSNHSGHTLVQSLLLIGGLGYVRKDNACEELIPAIRAAYAGKQFLGKRVEE